MMFGRSMAGNQPADIWQIRPRTALSARVLQPDFTPPAWPETRQCTKLAQLRIPTSGK